MFYMKITEEDSYIGFYKLHFLWVQGTNSNKKQKELCYLSNASIGPKKLKS